VAGHPLGGRHRVEKAHGEAGEGEPSARRIQLERERALLRGGLLPQAYVSPAEMRATRDLLRRRMHLARKRGERRAHVHNTNRQ